MNYFCGIMAFLLALMRVIGEILCIVNVLQVLFMQGGSYSAALTGFILYVIGTLLGKISISFSNKK